MRLKLLLFTFLFTSFGFSQTINTYNNASSSNYILVSSASAIDQNATGTDLIWNFNTFTAAGASSDVFGTPAAEELSTYPGTTIVQTTTSGGAITKIFIKDVASEISFTGATNPDFDFNYITDNGVLGTFPLSYGYSNSDAIAGNLTNASLGTVPFSGTLDTSVDATGVLNLNDVGAGPYSGTVTRLKISQSVNFTVVIIVPFAGTALQTTYNYYDNSTGNLVFRNTTIDIDIPNVFSDSDFVLEVLSSVTLSDSKDLISDNSFSIHPNPVNKLLYLSLDKISHINSIAITDIHGKRVIKTKEYYKTIDVSFLTDGIYFLTIETDKNVLTKKFIKN